MNKEIKPIFISHAEVLRLAPDSPAGNLLELANLYRDSWAGAGITLTTNEAAAKIAAYDPRETFVVRDESGLIRAAINTLPVQAAGIIDLITRFPTYRAVESASRSAALSPHRLAASGTHRICFSIVARPDYRVGAGESAVPLARFLLNGVYTQSPERLVAYSRFSGVNGLSTLDLLRYYLNNCSPERSRVLGAVGMHEHFGGVLTAIIPRSRPEDTDGGMANALVVYPHRDNPEEATLLAQIKAKRQRGIYGDREHITTGALLFTDLPVGY